MTKKYETIYQDLLADIRNLDDGAVIPSVRTLMRRYQVSQITIAKVLDLLKKDGLIATRVGGRTVRVDAEAASLGRRKRILFAMSDYPSTFGRNLKKCFESYFKGKQYHFATIVYNHGNLDFDKLKPGLDCDYLIMNADLDLRPEVVCQLIELDAKVIFIDAMLQGMQFDAVCADNEYAGALAAYYFSRSRQSGMAVLLSLPVSHNSLARVRGFLRELKLCGQDCRTIDCRTAAGENATANAYHAFRQYVEQNTLTFSALFCDSDLGALGVLKACNELNIAIPGELEIIGCDNIEECGYFHPSLSSIHQQIEIWPEEVEKIIELRSQDAARPGVKTLIEPVIIYRESTRGVSNA